MLVSGRYLWPLGGLQVDALAAMRACKRFCTGGSSVALQRRQLPDISSKGGSCGPHNPNDCAPPRMRQRITSRIFDDVGLL